MEAATQTLTIRANWELYKSGIWRRARGPLGSAIFTLLWISAVLWYKLPRLNVPALPWWFIDAWILIISLAIIGGFALVTYFWIEDIRYARDVAIELNGNQLIRTGPYRPKNPTTPLPARLRGLTYSNGRVQRRIWVAEATEGSPMFWFLALYWKDDDIQRLADAAGIPLIEQWQTVNMELPKAPRW